MVTMVCDRFGPKTTLRAERGASKRRTRPAESDPAACPLPQLGFCSFVISGTGEYVLSVDRHTAAARIGLEAGDVILALNGQRLQTEGAWYQAMARAAASDGRVTLRIRNGRTGHIAQRTCRVFSGAWAAAAEG
jgi:S1-C subfamily serine protease